MTTSRFDEYWQAHFPELAPAGLAFQESLRTRWLRIHSLPGSKRYADSPEERAELLQRHRRVADVVLGASSACALLVAGFSDAPGPADEPTLARLPQLAFTQALVDHPDWLQHPRSDAASLNASVALVAWEFERFEAFILAVADDHVDVATFLSFDTGQIYAPYDGGADLIFVSEAERDARARDWSTWLSSNPTGL